MRQVDQPESSEAEYRCRRGVRGEVARTMVVDGAGHPFWLAVEVLVQGVGSNHVQVGLLLMDGDSCTPLKADLIVSRRGQSQEGTRVKAKDPD